MVIYIKSFLEVSRWIRGKLYWFGFFFTSLHWNSLKYHVLKRLLTFSWGSLLLLPAGFFNSLKIFYLLRALLHPLNTQGTVLTQWSDTAELKRLQKLPVKLPNHCTVSWECNENSLRICSCCKGWSLSRQQPSDERRKLHKVLQGQQHQAKERRSKYNLKVKSLHYLLQHHQMSMHRVWEAVSGNESLQVSIVPLPGVACQVTANSSTESGLSQLCKQHSSWQSSLLQEYLQI